MGSDDVSVPVVGQERSGATKPEAPLVRISTWFSSNPLAGVIHHALHTRYVLGQHAQGAADRLRTAEAVELHHTILHVYGGADRVGPRLAPHRVQHGAVDAIVGKI